MQVQKFEETTDYVKYYGFRVFNDDGRSLPKGMISSMRVEQFSDGTNQIEYSVQSPSGFSPDSSDHLTFTMPALETFEKGKAVVKMYGEMINAYIFEKDQVA
jgi:hypothetical protein